MEFTIEPFEAEMAKACAVIAATAPDPWRQEAFENLAGQKNHLCFVAVAAAEPVGFACFLAVHETADLQLVAVDPAQRRKGVARALLAHGCEQLKKQGVGRVLLEARSGNKGALGLYESLGFTPLALRRGMYQNPAEDGILMAKLL